MGCCYPGRPCCAGWCGPGPCCGPCCGPPPPPPGMMGPGYGPPHGYL